MPGPMPKMPKAGEEVKASFRALLPKDPRISLRPMFGNLAAFANGNMFTGLFGEDLFVRVSDENRARLIKEGGGDFEPMPGHAMKGYATLPSGWRKNDKAAKQWISRSLDFALTLPAKAPKK